MATIGDDSQTEIKVEESEIKVEESEIKVEESEIKVEESDINGLALETTELPTENEETDVPRANSSTNKFTGELDEGTETTKNYSFNSSIEIDDSDDDEMQEEQHHADNQHEEGSLNNDVKCNSMKTEIQKFPRCEAHYSAPTWGKAIARLQKIGFFTWEINTMFGAMEQELENEEKRGIKRKKPELVPRNKKPRFADEPISGVLLPSQKYVTHDLRANIGDACSPSFHIPLHYQGRLFSEFHKFINQTELCAAGPPILDCAYVNDTLMIECRDAEVLAFVEQNIRRLNGIWPKSDFVLLPRTCGRRKIEISVPYFYENVDEVLEIIKKQNRLPVDEWKVASSVKWEEGDGMCLHVEVDGGTYLRLIQDQDDLFVLMKRAIVKVPAGELES